MLCVCAGARRDAAPSVSQVQQTHGDKGLALQCLPSWRCWKRALVLSQSCLGVGDRDCGGSMRRNLWFATGQSIFNLSESNMGVCLENQLRPVQCFLVNQVIFIWRCGWRAEPTEALNHKEVFSVKKSVPDDFVAGSCV